MPPLEAWFLPQLTGLFNFWGGEQEQHSLSRQMAFAELPQVACPLSTGAVVKLPVPSTSQP